MILGSVNSFHEAFIRLQVSGPQGIEREIEAIVDTGFTGFLSLPPSLVSILDIPFRRRGRAQLADGSEAIFDVYEGTVVWDGQSRRIAIDEAETEPLVGMALLHGYELTIQVVKDGSVTIKTLLPNNS